MAASVSEVMDRIISSGREEIWGLGGPRIMETVLKGRKRVVCITPDRPTVLVGRCVSSAVRRRPIGEARVSCVEIAKNEALAQVAAGADVINVNGGAMGLDQVEFLPCAVELIQETVEVPISIETSNPEALIAALKACRGRPLINAVDGGEQSLNQILPLAAEYGAAVIGRCKDGEGVPDDPYGRLEIARKITERAQALGIPRENVLIDCLTQAVETNPEAALITLETVRLVRAELEANMALDISAVSNELPNCASLHQALLTAAIAEGVNVPIIDVARDRQVILALDVILGRDESAKRYIRYYHYRRSGMRDLVDWEMVG
jgi:5-methyltetrahydrofolate--homocysteine methyltransferase